MNPSKELLREVLDIEINEKCKVVENKNYILVIRYKDTDYGRQNKTLININIHELAYKCKKWALNEGYELVEGSDVICVYKMSDNTGDECFSASTSDKDFDIERFFRCCEWILEQKAKS
ncbi:MAG: hypothetical protein E3J96_00205 [Sulfurovum sp.]|nr:MAG: hypothetical protein E3J96_00205 [Sulfurovum sp.]